MSQTIKILVLAFLQNLPENPSEQFNKAFELYKQSPNKNRAAESTYNRKGFTDQSLKNLLYDLQKINGITDVEILDTTPVQELKEIKNFFEGLIEAFEKLDEVSYTCVLGAVLASQKFSDLIETNQVLKELMTVGSEKFEQFKLDNPELLNEEGTLELSDIFDAYIEEDINFFDDFEIPDFKAPALDDDKSKFLDELFEKAGAAIITSTVGENYEPIKTEELTSLREEFSFLNEEGCPDVMYVIVGRRIASYRKYQALHAKLQEVNAGNMVMSDEEKTQLTLDCDAAFTENRLLWDELEHYGKTKEILGKHPMFRQENIKKEVEEMTQKQLMSFVSSSNKYFHDQKKALEKHKDNPEQLAVINQRIADREYKLGLVNSKLGVDAGEKK